MDDRIEVCIIIDTEFANAGAFARPVLTYLDYADPRAPGKGRPRGLQITAASWPETEALLWAAQLHTPRAKHS